MVNKRKTYILLIILVRMKQVFTVSLDEETVKRVRAAYRGRFRNKSHRVEEAILKFLEADSDV